MFSYILTAYLNGEGAHGVLPLDSSLTSVSLSSVLSLLDEKCNMG